MTDDLELLLSYLTQARAFDFRAYKRSTLARRVQKRMQMVGVESFGDYGARAPTFGIAAADVGRRLQDLEISYRPVELRSLVE